jgi:selenocysteine-specific elongation factor
LMLISSQAFAALAAQVLEMLSAHHKREPLSLGISREEVRERLFGGLKPEIFRAVIAYLAEQGKVVAERDALRMASHKPALTGADADTKQALEAAFKATGLQAGTLDEIAAATKVNINLAKKFYSLLIAEQRIIRVGDFIFHVDAIEDLKARVRAHKSISPKIDVAVFKVITGGLTRKYAIPLLEFLDRQRITRRVGNEREIL